MSYQLIIGNKNYSSWSMRPWVLMRELGISFEEKLLEFDDMQSNSLFKQAVAQVSPVGRVPVLIDSACQSTQAQALVVWDSLAIIEYLAELHERVWPHDAVFRSRARSLCCEMHSGYGKLRTYCPMNIEANLQAKGSELWQQHPDLRVDVDLLQNRLESEIALSGGPFLLGNFCAADAYYAPVMTRLMTYGLPVSATLQKYMDLILNLSSVKAWMEDAKKEHRFVPVDEPYRTAAD